MKFLTLISYCITSGLAVSIYYDDDTATYISNGLSEWNNQSCSHCQFTIDLDDPFNRTLRLGVISPNDASAASMSFEFTGTGVTVFGILPADGYGGDQTMSFSMDGGSRNKSVFPTAGANYKFNAPFYNITGLSNANHTLNMTVQTFAFIDYFVVEVPTLTSALPVVTLTTSVGDITTTIQVADVLPTKKPSAAEQLNPTRYISLVLVNIVAFICLL